MSHQNIMAIMERIRGATESSPILVSTSSKPGCLYCAFGDTVNSRGIEETGTGRVHRTSTKPDGKAELEQTVFIGMYHGRMNLMEVEDHLRAQLL